MKPVLFLLSAIALLFGCNLDSNDEVKENIAGTYIRTSQHEYGNEWDTLAISVQNKAANEYNLTRRWRYDRVLGGKALEPEYKVTTSVVTYNTESKKLEEAQTGKTYTLDVNAGVLFSGTTKYQKLK